jgi:cell division septation protein DedD
MDVPNRDKFVYRRIKGDVEPPSVEKLLAEPEEPLPPPQPASPAVPPAEAAAPIGTAAAEAPASEGTASPPAEIGAASASTDAPGDAPSDAALPADGAVATAMVIPAPRERPGQAKAAAATAAPSQPVKPTSPVPPAASAAQPARQPSPVAAAAPARSVAANGGRYRVQIGSVASPDQAKSEWQRLRSRHGDLLASLQAEFVRADLGNRGVVYRVRVGPLQGEEKARSLCRSLAGRNVGCMVVAPSG